VVVEILLVESYFDMNFGMDNRIEKVEGQTGFHNSFGWMEEEGVVV